MPFPYAPVCDFQGVTGNSVCAERFFAITFCNYIFSLMWSTMYETTVTFGLNVAVVQMYGAITCTHLCEVVITKQTKHKSIPTLPFKVHFSVLRIVC